MRRVVSSEIIIFFEAQTSSLEVKNTFYTKKIRSSSINCDKKK